MAENSIKMLISKKNLLHNIKYLENKYGKKILPVLKANAYGHGIKIVSKILHENGYKEFAVARLSEVEKILIDKKLNDSKILVFESIGKKYYSKLKEYPAIYVTANTFYELKEMIADGIPSERIQIKIDFGFGRNGIGIDEIEKLKEFIKKNSLFFAGIYSHLYAVEYNEGIELMDSFINIVKYLGKERFEMVHIQNSVGILFYGNREIMTHLRSGIYIYGLQEEGFYHEGLKQVFSLEGKVAGVRDISQSKYLAYNSKLELGAEKCSYVAKIKIGYGDGFVKANEKSYCLINDKYYKILSVTMDNTFIEVDSNIKEGDRVVLYPEAEKVRENTGLHICEMLPMINSRIERVII